MTQQEVVSVHIGQAGVQLGHAFWELACAEHGIKPDGTVDPADYDNDDNRSFFHETPSEQFVPRALLIDLEPTVLDEVRIGRYHRLFHPELLVNGKEDAGNNFARGHYTLGRAFISCLIEKTRMITEGCDNCQGFTVFNSWGGGTGSGLTTLYIDRLKVEYGKKPCINLGVYPGNRLSTSTVEPYNSILMTERTLDTTDICLPFDNESMYNICKSQIDLDAPTYSDVNRLIAPMVSGLTSSLRHGGSLNCSINEIRTNLVPYPRIHFPIMSYSPMANREKLDASPFSTVDLTNALFYEYNRSMSCNLELGKFMAACLIYRGNNSPSNIIQALKHIKCQQTYPWVDWCPTGYKVGMTYSPPTHLTLGIHGAVVERGVLMLANHTAISQTFDTLCSKFDKLYRKRSFIHWYVGEGMEEGEFIEARCTLGELIRDYYEVSEHSESKYPEPEVYTQDQYRERNKPMELKYEKCSTAVEPFVLTGVQ